MSSFTDPNCPICLQDVSYIIEDKEILRNITIKIQKDGITGIIGPSGSGKSTFLRLLNRLISPTTGKILLDRVELREIPPRELRKTVGLVQQRPFLFSGTVRDNLIYGPQIWEIKYTEAILLDLLVKVALPSDFLDRNIAGLSGGEQQRVSLARSLANQPRILLLDEPTSALDIGSEEVFEKTLRALSGEGIKIIIVTHSLEQTKRLTDQLLFLREGQLIESTTTQGFFQRYNEEDVRMFFKGKDVII